MSSNTGWFPASAWKATWYSGTDSPGEGGGDREGEIGREPGGERENEKECEQNRERVSERDMGRRRGKAEKGRKTCRERERISKTKIEKKEGG